MLPIIMIYARHCQSCYPTTFMPVTETKGYLSLMLAFHTSPLASSSLSTTCRLLVYQLDYYILQTLIPYHNAFPGPKA